MPEPQVSLVLQAPDGGEFHPAEVVTVCHRFVTALFGAEKCAKAVPERTSFLASLSQ